MYNMEPNASDFYAINPNYPTIDYLRMMRHHALKMALYFYAKWRDNAIFHPGFIVVIERDRESFQYWTARAFHYQGEILALANPQQVLEAAPLLPLDADSCPSCGGALAVVPRRLVSRCLSCGVFWA